MSAANREAIIKRIKAMMAMADVKSNGSPNEIATAARKYQELMARYNVDLAEVLAADPNNESLYKFVRKFIKVVEEGTRKHLPPYMTILIDVCGDVNSVRTLVTRRRHEAPFFALIGREDQIEVCAQMYYSFVNQMQYLVNIEVKRQKRLERFDYYESATVYRNSWLLGAAETIADLLRQQAKSTQAEAELPLTVSAGATVIPHTANTMALMVVTEQKLDAFVDKMYPKLGHAHRSKAQFSAGGYSAGQEAGRNIHAHQGLKDAGRKMLK